MRSLDLHVLSSTQHCQKYLHHQDNNPTCIIQRSKASYLHGEEEVDCTTTSSEKNQGSGRTGRAAPNQGGGVDYADGSGTGLSRVAQQQ